MDIPPEPPAAIGYADYLSSVEARYHLPAGLLGAIQAVESRGNSKAVSPKGALGRFQFMPPTAARYGIDPRNDHEAADGAGRYLADNFRKFHSWPLAIAAYNAGENAVAAYGAIPPYPETQHYVPAVMAAMGQQYSLSEVADDRTDDHSMLVRFDRPVQVAARAPATNPLNEPSVIRFR